MRVGGCGRAAGAWLGPLTCRGVVVVVVGGAMMLRGVVPSVLALVTQVVDVDSVVVHHVHITFSPPSHTPPMVCGVFVDVKLDALGLHSLPWSTWLECECWCPCLCLCLVVHAGLLGCGD